MLRSVIIPCVLIACITNTVAVAKENRLRDRIRAVLGRTPITLTQTTPMNNSSEYYTIAQFGRPLTDSSELVEIVRTYQTEALELFKKITTTEWEAMTTGKGDAFKRSAEAKLDWAKYHSNKEVYEKIKDLRSKATGLHPIVIRAAERMEKEYAKNQLPEDVQKQMIEMSSEIEKVFQTHRPKLDGKEYSNNDLLEMIAAETDSARRHEIWKALKQVGEEVNEKIIALAKVRNEAAQKLGFKNYWEMQIVFQEYKPEELLKIFEDLEKMTRPLFETMKAELDAELSAKFSMPAEQLMPWHYDNPFFQQAPPSKEVNPNDFYKDKTKEEIVAIAIKYYKHIGLPYEKVLEKSDMFEREGKNQHAFSIDMDTLERIKNCFGVFCILRA